MTMPRFSLTSLSTSSGTFRGWSATARALECEKMTGAFVTLSAAFIVASETCDRSTSMPSRFISSTTSSPKRVRPWAFGASEHESAQSSDSECVRVMYRTPSRWKSRRTPSEFSIECPPSTPIRHAIRPDLRTRRTSSAV